MDTQTWLNPLIVFSPTEHLSEQPVQACSHDYGFDFDEEEIAREMLATLPVALSTSENQLVDADESQFTNLWFLS